MDIGLEGAEVGANILAVLRALFWQNHVQANDLEYNDYFTD